jgi:hypothetical protein
MAEFVLLLHECPSGVPRATHWDLMLQVGGVLRTWVLHALPAAWKNSPVDAEPPAGSRDRMDVVAAEEIQSHRLDYLSLEGPLSGDRGSVVRVDRGRYELLEAAECRVRLRLSGERIRGVLELTRPTANTAQWQLSLAGAARGTE